MKEKSNPDLSFPFDTPPEPGSLMEIAEGVHWLRLPIPFELNHINLWLLEDGDGYTLVDTGISSEQTRQAWEHLFSLLPADRPLKRIIVTHFHPDHFGLARWLCERTGAVYYTSRETGERTSFLLKTADKTTKVETRMQFYQSHDIENSEFFEDFLKGRFYTHVVSGYREPDHVLSEGDNIDIGENCWRVIMTYGHAPGHITLYSEALGLLISGDQILPTITSNVSVYADQPEANPLDEYLQSFQQFASLPNDTTVLPSHGRVFTGIHTRLEQIRQHHEDTLEKVQTICGQAHTTRELIPKLFRRKLEGINSVLATGEAIAHLNYLCEQGNLQRTLRADIYVFQH